ncbi:NUDIX hydrolase [Anabaena cylindrica FACHB-243]|uniref:NUDIX hydrolase n=1 Tax=Anabaena cylindrica (strain ATCC 27899 / PCC 7122) TaxID=272123 RepID=K9ZQD4_ANACC|nr:MULTISPECIES: NUDIX hydrolase [Anabaena]AFZ61386.1 NUDIX hydrolase [Anabaena cylindrica PCC 7122]MBD2420382.1 NUDIX hydrolase [Anabaena cylindrica FACHB-243]MBY5281874.1 NUDIX hydrolase [Anabaena sp. CCAP 1446/1C]MBY5306977.1 NUDIX hydrolase [Anabaena sp. CCAP 1446/1C]MCM2405995.1 NUDIX hydrolase [Anabaena sp. CCAP 1446/1C]
MKNPDKPNGEKLGWKIQKSQLIFQSQWYNLRQDKITLPKNQEITYTYIEHPGSVFVVPITANQEIILIRSYRYTIDDWCWEVPAGNLGDQKGLSPEEVARLELAEEIGGIAETFQSLGWYYMANGLASLKNFYFIAYNVTLNQGSQREVTEIINEVKTVSIKNIFNMIQEGLIKDGESAFAMMLALSHINRSNPRL